jgi:DNA-directed RNA polymerase specialized sigma24 family protein
MKRGTRQECAWADALTHSSRRTEELAVGSDPELDEMVGNAELGLRVASAGQRLPEEYRRVVEIRHLREQSRAAIAAQLGKSPVAIRM